MWESTIIISEKEWNKNNINKYWNCWRKHDLSLNILPFFFLGATAGAVSIV
jgi:hypothetical protein